jgi:hypothetical protein
MQIVANLVTAVLLPDGWHRVKGKSFVVEPYGFDGNGVGKTARAGEAAVALPGATWMKSKGRFVSCPLSSILAVRHAADKGDGL